MSLEHTYLEMLKEILADSLRGCACEVYLFGSRANGEHAPGADIDVAVRTEEEISVHLSKARERFEASNIPYQLDLVDLSRTSKSFVDAVEREGLLLWKN